MSIRDLVYKIVPAKVIIRELKTGSGKTLSKDSEYVLLEQKKFVTVGKKQVVEYTFDLDIKDDNKDRENEQKRLEEKERQRNPFFMNLESFSMFKLKSALFLIDFPMNFLIRIMDIWYKLMPQQPSAGEFPKEDLMAMNQAKTAMRELRHNMLDYIEHLQSYLQDVKKKKPVKHSFAWVVKSDCWSKFRGTMLKSKNTFLTSQYVEGL